MTSAKTVYRALLRCYPAAFREEYGQQMLLAFADQLGEARRSGDRLSPAALWAGATLDVFTIAPREHCHVIFEDLRYALRTMAANPAFTAVAILSLALGIGANTAIFSLWNGLLHGSLPGVAAPRQLVMLTDPTESGSWTGRTDGPRTLITYEEFEQLRDHADVFTGLMASQSSLEDWRVRQEGGGWEEVHGRMVSGGYFQVLGVNPFIGQVFTTAYDRAAPPSAVIGYNYWQRRFGGRPDVLGKSLSLAKITVTIIGVTPPGFIGESNGQQPDLWLPLRLQPGVMPGIDRLHDTPPAKSMWLHAFGRLKPGVSATQAEARVNALFQAGLETFYGALATGERRKEFLNQQLRLTPAAGGASNTRHEFAHSLTALLAAVGVLLSIACANLANLLLARGAGRKREITLRLWLGASRGRLIRQLITESLALAAMGGAAAILVAYLLHGALVRMLAESDPRFQMPFAMDPMVAAFLVAAIVASALAFGILPAWQVTRGGGAGLERQGRGSLGSRGQSRAGRVLVSLQLALSLPLLVGAGLLARTVYNLERADLGFPTGRLLLARVDLRSDVPEVARRDALAHRLLGEIRRIPGVRAASYSQLGVFNGGESSNDIAVEGYTPKSDSDRNSAMDVVGPGYFTALGVPIVLGRDIQDRDDAAAPKVCVINEAFARQFFNRRNPIGMRVTLTDEAGPRTTYQVVGVAKDARTQSLREAIDPRYFVAGNQAPESVKSPTLLVRTAGDTAPVAAALRRTMQRVDAGLPILYVRPVEEQMAPLTAQDRATAQLAVVFGCVALALAAIGLYGVLSYGMARRTGEIAIRMALGSRPGRVVAMILRETMGLVMAGLAAGAGLAWAASGVVHSRLYGVAPEDPGTLVLAVSLLVLVALGAAYLPARRASKLDPMAALRQE